MDNLLYINLHIYEFHCYLLFQLLRFYILPGLMGIIKKLFLLARPLWHSVLSDAQHLTVFAINGSRDRSSLSGPDDVRM